MEQNPQIRLTRTAIDSFEVYRRHGHEDSERTWQVFRDAIGISRITLLPKYTFTFRFQLRFPDHDIFYHLHQAAAMLS